MLGSIMTIYTFYLSVIHSHFTLYIENLHSLTVQVEALSITHQSRFYTFTDQKQKMKSAKDPLPLAFLPLVFALLLCFAVCVASRKHGNGRNRDEKAIDGGNTWCIAKPSTENFRLSSNIDYSCTQNGVNCKPIQPGGTCFRPDTIISHASYAMNLFYRAAGKNTWNCHFNGTGIIVAENPSIGSCNYPL
ncbi:hypothetical protein QUC31_005024 [Theobroma cacao]|uniref:Uncharacterized protein LOC18613785 isoform X2 n=2 Tax=Theobroma cacao TaxID=3641 RepID=A0AB32VSD1_THECC|nr:PREDICTED: uncharacterized protein LOC18613785 isoform X2 [Theobroma cacao]EOX95409.1 O-Glycosyl hydrolases family 17 protein [Theobroma cacao]WRX10697.1 X8 domain - like 3 [Theobroma cacao]